MNDVTRRGFLGIAGAATAAVGLSACAGTGTSPTGGGSGGGGAGGINTIDFWSNHPGNSKPTEQKLIAAFEAANPSLKVKLTDAGKNYEEVAQKFNAALSGGQLPDVVVVSDVTWFNFALNKQLAPLDGLLAAANISTSDYVDSLYKDYLFADKHYALPFARSTPLFYYNKELWAAAGLPDRGPKTWDEFAEWGPKLAQSVGSDKSALLLNDGSNAWTGTSRAWCGRRVAATPRSGRPPSRTRTPSPRARFCRTWPSRRSPASIRARRRTSVRVSLAACWSRPPR